MNFKEKDNACQKKDLRTACGEQNTLQNTAQTKEFRASKEVQSSAVKNNKTKWCRKIKDKNRIH